MLSQCDVNKVPDILQLLDVQNCTGFYTKMDLTKGNWQNVSASICREDVFLHGLQFPLHWNAPIGLTGQQVHLRGSQSTLLHINSSMITQSVRLSGVIVMFSCSIHKVLGWAGLMVNWAKPETGQDSGHASIQTRYIPKWINHPELWLVCDLSAYRPGLIY